MPVYAYECQSCGHAEEVVASISSASQDCTCSSCGRQLKRVISKVNFAFAGNPGPKLRNRVNLDDELKRQGFKAPLFKSEEAKDKARWAIKKYATR